VSILSKISDYVFKKSHTVTTTDSEWVNLGGLPSTGYNRKKLKAPNKKELIENITSVVYSAINLNSNAFADVGWTVFRKNNKDENIPDMNSPEAVLLRSVNGLMEGSTLNYLTNTWKDSAGCAFWWVKRNENNGKPESIYPLSPANTTPFIKKGTIDIQFYRYSTGGTHFDIPEEEVIRFYNPSFIDPFTLSYSPLEAVWSEKAMWDTETNSAVELLKNNSRADTIFFAKDFDGRMMPEQAQKLERTLKNSIYRAGTGGIAVSGIPLTKETLSFSSKDAELLARKGATKIDILNALGIPTALFEGKDINRATLQTAMIQHGTYAIKPRIKSFQDTLNEKFFPMFGSDLQIEFENPVPIDRVEEAKLEEIDLNNGVVTINEVREKRKLAPVVWGNEPYIPVNLLQPTQREALNQGVKNVKQEKSIQQNIGNVYEEFIEYRQGKSDIARLYRVAKSEGVSYEKIGDWLKEIEPMKVCKQHCCSGNETEMKAFRKTNKIPSSKPLEKIFRDIFNDQESQIIKALKKASKDFDGIKIKAFPDDAQGFMTAIKLAKWEEETAKRVRPQVTIDTGKGVEKTIGILKAENIGFEQTVGEMLGSKKTEEAILKQVIPLGESTVATTVKSLDQAVVALKKELLAGLIDEGDALPSMVKRVQAIFKNAELHRARAIAVTESNKAFNNGTLLSAEQSNVVKAMKWILSPNPCIICETIAGETPGVTGTPEVAIGQKFTNTDKMFGDIEHPPAHVNCECTLGVVLIDF
jgi:HK97 family phage portal protein